MTLAWDATNGELIELHVSEVDPTPLLGAMKHLEAP